MKMEALNVKTPQKAKKSLAMALLEHNLVKAVPQETSQSEGVELKLIEETSMPAKHRTRM